MTISFQNNVFRAPTGAVLSKVLFLTTFSTKAQQELRKPERCKRSIRRKELVPHRPWFRKTEPHKMVPNKTERSRPERSRPERSRPEQSKKTIACTSRKQGPSTKEWSRKEQSTKELSRKEQNKKEQNTKEQSTKSFSWALSTLVRCKIRRSKDRQPRPRRRKEPTRTFLPLIWLRNDIVLVGQLTWILKQKEINLFYTFGQEQVLAGMIVEVRVVLFIGALRFCADRFTLFWVKVTNNRRNRIIQACQRHFLRITPYLAMICFLLVIVPSGGHLYFKKSNTATERYKKLIMEFHFIT